MDGCPFHSDDESERRRRADRDDRADDDGNGDHGWSSTGSVDRRAFVKSAVAIGGTSALSACLNAEMGTPTEESETDPATSTPPDPSPTAAAPASQVLWPQGDPSQRPERQHLWTPAEVDDQYGNPVPPHHQLVLLYDYDGDDVATARETMERTFRQLEQAFMYDQMEGLLFQVGYSAAYFERHQDGIPTSIDFEGPKSVSPHNDPELRHDDVFLHIASNRASIVLAAEVALQGQTSSVNGVSIEDSLADHFTLTDRRSVFVGDNLPARHIDHEGISTEAPLSMGFKSAFTDSIPPEDRITITEGPWQDATIAQVSKLRLELDDWYEKSREERIDEMFAPDYTAEDVGSDGGELGKGSGRAEGEGFSEELAEQTEDYARERGIVGHSQKVARARDDDFDVKLLRRDGNITTEGGGGGLSFVGLVRAISDWFDVAEMMYDPDLDAIMRNEEQQADATDHHPRSGIAAEMDVRSRGHFLIPPRSHRALPPTTP